MYIFYNVTEKLWNQIKDKEAKILSFSLLWLKICNQMKDKEVKPLDSENSLS